MKRLVLISFVALCVMLWAIIASADDGGKLSSPSAAPPSSPLAVGFSAWQPLFLMRDGVINTHRSKGFNDTRFEYRWKSEVAVNSGVCTVEIRATGDDEYNDTIPEVNVIYTAGNHVVLRAQMYIAKDVAVGGRMAHAYLKASECERIDFVVWKK